MDHGTKVELSCISGYSLAGSILITCIKDKNWKYENPPHCVLGRFCSQMTGAIQIYRPILPHWLIWLFKGSGKLCLRAYITKNTGSEA